VCELRWRASLAPPFDYSQDTFYTTQPKILPCLSGKFKIDHFPNLVNQEISHFFAIIMISVFISSNF